MKILEGSVLNLYYKNILRLALSVELRLLFRSYFPQSCSIFFS